MRQASIDPETIFGKISPLNVDGKLFQHIIIKKKNIKKFNFTRILLIEIFRGREYRFRPRSSSADWTGLDALTEEEELEYKVCMGFL
jgi:hypothetical protein